jgi:phosphoglucomutase
VPRSVATADDAYLEVAATAVIDPSVFRATKLKVAFTNIHGTGAASMRCRCCSTPGRDVHAVPEQLEFRRAFPDGEVPESGKREALSRAVALAGETGHCRRRARDRSGRRPHGVAVRNRAGKMELLTGNQIGALLADYRLTQVQGTRA